MRRPFRLLQIREVKEVGVIEQIYLTSIYVLLIFQIPKKAYKLANRELYRLEVADTTMLLMVKLVTSNSTHVVTQVQQFVPLV